MKPGFDASYDWLTSIDWANGDEKLIDTLVDGIKNTAGAIKDAVSGALSNACHLLPFSDAEERPMSSLTPSGQTLAETSSAGILRRARVVVEAVADVMRIANDSLTAPARVLERETVWSFRMPERRAAGPAHPRR